VQRERDRGAPFAHALLEVHNAAIAADELDPLVGARVADAQDRREQVVLEQAHVEARDRVGARHEFGPNPQAVPAIGDEHPEGLRLRRLHGRRARLDAEARTDLREQRVRRQPAQVGDDAVVGENPHLVVRKRDREKELVAREGDVGRAPLQRDARRGRGAMAVRDVQSVERVECRAQRLDLRSRGDAPDGVHDVVRPHFDRSRDLCLA
jgi:hypothetical protein